MTDYYQSPVPVDPLTINNPSALTPLRAHYLKRDLVTRQFAIELDSLSTPHALSLLGPPFLLPHQFRNGIPISSSSSSSSSSPPSSNNHSDPKLPFLSYFFHHFVLTFPFILSASPDFFSHKLQPFFYSFLSRNFSSSEDRDEETRRRKIAQKVEKHLGLLLAAAIKLVDNQGQEHVIRLSPLHLPTPNDHDAFLATPTHEPDPIPSSSSSTQSSPFEVNVVGIRPIRQKARMRHKAHEEFLIRTRIPPSDDVYVSRRYGDFVKLAQALRLEFPDSDIRSPPAKDRRSVDGPSADASPPLDPSDDLSSPPIHFTRERNRLTLRAYLHRLLANSTISNSLHLRNFLLDQPISLSLSERQDVDSRAAMDRARENEHAKFKSEVEARVRELDGYLRAFREQLVKSDGLTRVFATIRTTDHLDDLPIEYRKVFEWAKISLASTIYQIFLGSDNSSAAFASLKRMHGLMPYWAMRGILKISNPVAMIRGIIDLFLARPFGASSLIQRMFTSGLYEEIRELTEDAEKVAVKIDDERLCERVRAYIRAPREIQQVFESDAKSESLDIMTIILRSSEGPPLDPPAYQRIQRASQAYEAYKAIRDALDDPESSHGPTNDDAWLFEDLHVYMRLLRRSRDKQQLIELIFEGTTSELLKDIVTIFYAPLMQVYKAANISDSLADLQKFIDDLIKTVERAEEFSFGDPQRIVQTFVDLVGRHEGAFYSFVHQVHSKGAGLFDGLMNWIERIVNFVRQGLPQRVSLETLLPHPDTPERLALISEIDSLIEYHQKLKWAHHERMTKRLARLDERQEDQVADAAFVQGVMHNLNLDSVLGGDVAEANREDDTDSEQDAMSEFEEAPDIQPRKKGKGNLKDRVPIEPPQLVLIPNLVPLFTVLVQDLLV